MFSSEKKKILVVDDELLVRKLFSKAMTDGGFECLIAGSAKEAIAILEKQTPDIILSDYQMPELDGFAFRKILMGDPRWENIPFIFLTSHTDQETMIKGLDLQVIDYIAKNTAIQILISKVNNILHAIEEENKKTVMELRKSAEMMNLRSVPQKSPVIDGYKIDFWHQTFQDHPGGDFVDFVNVNDQFTFIVLGDVMGKKWGAWVFSFSFLSYIRSAVRLCIYEKDFSASSILKKINHVVYMDQVLSDVLSSLSLLLIDHKSGRVTYSGAGDLPPVYYRTSTKTTEPVRSAGLLLGLFEDGEYDEQTVNMEKGDKLFVFTDGMTDFEDEFGKRSDYNLFIDKITPFLEDELPLESIRSSLFSKEAGKNPIDDCSIILIEKT